MEMSLPLRPESVAFRFFADFTIQLPPNASRGFTTQQQTLLESIARSPATLRRIARMALETDLAGITGKHLSDLFPGPDNEEILDCVLMCLSEKDKSYWLGLRRGTGDTLHQELVPVFLAFAVTLRRAGIEELNASAEPMRKTVGRTLDACDLRDR